ncbi:MAG: hypothetical protein PHC90_14870 [Syntrophorhabdaceae bacterium]|nr:hypothetical protein [Syntrophorhabdaceae bacterium]
MTGKRLFRWSLTAAVLVVICAPGWSANSAETAEGAFKRTLLSEAVIRNTGAKAVNLHFNGVPLNDALLSLGRQGGASITIDREIDASKVKVSAYYEGDSFEEAIETIVSGLDYACRKVVDGAYVVTPYEEAILNVHDVYVRHKESLNDTSSSNNRSLNGTSSSSTTGAYSSSGTSENSSGSSSTGDKTEDREMTKIIDSIKKMLSAKGVATPMTAGFVYVRDIPSRIKMVKEMLDTDLMKRKTITMKITLVRIDYKDEFETGLNWYALLKSRSPSVALNTNFTQTMGDSNVATLLVIDEDFAGFIKMLGTYGDVHVVHSWESRAVSGAVLPFEMSQTVWYTTGSVIQVVNNQTITTPQMASMEVGLKMTVNPLKLDKGYLVNTSVDLSNLLGFQVVEKIELPQVERNYVSIPIKMSVGETVAISGFKIKSTDKKRVGIPLLSNLPVLSYLFGYNSSQDRTSELTVLINFVEEKGDREI